MIFVVDMGFGGWVLMMKMEYFGWWNKNAFVDKLEIFWNDGEHDFSPSSFYLENISLNFNSLVELYNNSTRKITCSLCE